jgi:hypothetical protein
MNAVIEITHYGANVTYVRDATVSQWLAATRRPPAIKQVTTSGALQAEVVVYRMAQSLFAAEIPLSCLDRCVPKQKLNLLKLSACQVT